MAELPCGRADLFRRAAGTALYIAIDRPSVQFKMHEIMSVMSTPTVMHWAKLHCLAWYMLQDPEERWDHESQRTPETLEVLTDTAWAADTDVGTKSLEKDRLASECHSAAERCERRHTPSLCGSAPLSSKRSNVFTTANPRDVQKETVEITLHVEVAEVP